MAEIRKILPHEHDKKETELSAEARAQLERHLDAIAETLQRFNLAEIEFASNKGNKGARVEIKHTFDPKFTSGTK
jgi:hypothetical protein